MTNLPSGTVTFLFTDIEASTKMAQEYPEKWESLRGRHHAILQSAIDAHNGYVFQIIGDAFCVAFHTVADALNAAVKTQQLLQQETWSPAPIKIRIGINTGTAQVDALDSRSGGYKGYTTLARAQRIMTVGYGGQILISNSSYELVRGELPHDIDLRDMGEHRLKGLPNPEHLWQVIVPGLQQDFPPVASLNKIANNLPLQLTSFIGREKETEEVKQELAQHRLVTLTGTGGTGKTRLSLQVAAEVLDQFPNGVWFVELAPLTDPDLVPQTILNILHFSEQAGKTPLMVLEEQLGNKKLLFILDNCEHLIEATTRVVHALLTSAPEIKILASSREALGVRGELTWHVPSLALPNPKSLPQMEQLTQYESVRLFIERAFLVQPHFKVDQNNAPAIAQICSRLDGIPLAIELAAARVKALNVEQIAARLDDRFRLLTGGNRTALERHQTLRAAIDWSYNLLSEDEKILFRRLSVFVGGWTLEAAESVCASTDTLDLLTRVVDKSLVNVDHEQADETRYYMLETVRQYALERLVRSSESELIRSRHFDFFLGFAEVADQRLRSAESLLWVTKFELEHNNLRAALQWSLDANVDSGLHLVGMLFWFWYLRGFRREGRKWAEDILAHSGAQVHSAFRAQALFVLGAMDHNLNDYSAASMALTESLKLSQAAGEKWWSAFALLWLGWVSNYTRDLTAARSSFEKALVMARELKDDWLVADLLRSLGAVIYRSDAGAARPFLEESLTLARKVGEPWLLVGVLMNSGLAAETQGQHEQARALLEESVPWCRKMKDKEALANALEGLSILLLVQGEIDKAEANLCESLALAVEIESQEAIGTSLVQLGGVAASRGLAKRAVYLLAAGESILKAHGLSISVWPIELAAYNRYVASVRTQLDEATFNAAWAEGSKMTLEQAIAFALEELQ